MHFNLIRGKEIFFLYTHIDRFWKFDHTDALNSKSSLKQIAKNGEIIQYAEFRCYNGENTEPKK